MPAYAVTRRIDPTTRDVPMLDSQWVNEDPPMMAVVANTLTTDLGSCSANPKFGVKFDRVQNADPAAGAAWEAEIRRALQRYVLAGLLVIDSVVVEADITGHTPKLLYSVGFTDVRAGRRATFRPQE